MLIERNSVVSLDRSTLVSSYTLKQTRPEKASFNYNETRNETNNFTCEDIHAMTETSQIKNQEGKTKQETL